MIVGKKNNFHPYNLFTYYVEPTWSGPTSKIWSDDQCNDLDNYGHLPQYNLDSCKKACVQNKLCTAINFIKGGGCVLRACSLPVPDPTWSYENHEGYFIIKGKTKCFRFLFFKLAAIYVMSL